MESIQCVSSINGEIKYVQYFTSTQSENYEELISKVREALYADGEMAQIRIERIRTDDEKFRHQVDNVIRLRIEEEMKERKKKAID